MCYKPMKPFGLLILNLQRISYKIYSYDKITQN